MSKQFLPTANDIIATTNCLINVHKISLEKWFWHVTPFRTATDDLWRLITDHFKDTSTLFNHFYNKHCTWHLKFWVWTGQLNARSHLPARITGTFIRFQPMKSIPNREVSHTLDQILPSLPPNLGVKRHQILEVVVNLYIRHKNRNNYKYIGWTDYSE